MADINALRQERVQHAAAARALLDTAQAAGRDMSGEEEAEFDRLMDASDKIEGRIVREERALEAARRIAQTRLDDGGDEPDDSAGGDEAERRARAFRAYVVGGRAALTPDQARLLQAGNDPEGGYLNAPQQFVADLLQNVDDAVPLRQLATVMQLTKAESLGVPTLDTDLNDADWTTELATGNQDDSLRFGKRELRPHPMAKRVKVSRTLLRLATMSPEDIVRARLAYKFSVTGEKAYNTGDGVKKPLGLFTASADGISTARDVTVGAAGALPLTSATADQLIDAKYTLKPQYWPRARWLFHRTVLATVRKLKDGNGQYIWQPGLAADRPDSIVDVPFVVSEFTPNTVASGQYIGMIGDFSYYWIVDSLALDVQRLVELYAENNQIGFIARYEGDGAPVLEEPFVRLKVG